MFGIVLPYQQIFCRNQFALLNYTTNVCNVNKSFERQSARASNARYSIDPNTSSFIQFSKAPVGREAPPGISEF